jgi:hypothetical protein
MSMDYEYDVIINTIIKTIKHDHHTHNPYS